MKVKSKLLAVLVVILSVNVVAVESSKNKVVFDTSDPACILGKAKTSNSYLAVKWYLSSAEQVAIYREVFHLGYEKIMEKVKNQQLKPGKWGVIFDVDETLLNNMQYDKEHVVEDCQPFTWSSWIRFVQKESSVATPGAVRVTCDIKKNGGKVILVTNRPGEVESVTLANLNKVGICYDSVVFASNRTITDKTPRFNAVEHGDYSHIIASNKNIPVFKVLAYFGDNIQDFPNITQKDAVKQDHEGSFFNKFGEEYFSLPNPIYGSWRGNQFN